MGASAYKLKRTDNENKRESLRRGWHFSSARRKGRPNRKKQLYHLGYIYAQNILEMQKLLKLHWKAMQIFCVRIALRFLLLTSPTATDNLGILVWGHDLPKAKFKFQSVCKGFNDLCISLLKHIALKPIVISFFRNIGSGIKVKPDVYKV